jgi:hypothetical protein
MFWRKPMDLLLAGCFACHLLHIKAVMLTQSQHDMHLFRNIALEQAYNPELMFKAL